MAWWCGLSCRVGERCSLPPNPSEKTKTLAAYEQPGSQARTAMGGRGDGGLPPYLPIQIFQDAESSTPVPFRHQNREWSM